MTAASAAAKERDGDKGMPKLVIPTEETVKPIHLLPILEHCQDVSCIGVISFGVQM